MWRRGWALALAIVAFTAMGQEERAADRRGQEVYDHWCAPCHAPGPGHPGTQALQALYRGEKPAVLEQREDLTPELTAYFVRNGVSVMAPFRKTEITDADLEALEAYLAP